MGSEERADRAVYRLDVRRAALVALAARRLGDLRELLTRAAGARAVGDREHANLVLGVALALEALDDVLDRGGRVGVLAVGEQDDGGDVVAVGERAHGVERAQRRVVER